jgi:hypothetical protein
LISLWPADGFSFLSVSIPLLGSFVWDALFMFTKNWFRWVWK